MAKGNQPAAKFDLDMARPLWLNKKFYNTVITKTYKDGDEYKDTNQLGTGDLLNAAKLLERSEAWIAEQVQ
jgi:hypothetical protein